MVNQSVSVVMPLFSPEKFARNAIRSILEQSELPIELILIDDSFFPWINESYLDSISQKGIRIIYIRNSENKGSAASLNAGMTAAEGSIICLINDDDMFEKNRIEKILQASRSADSKNFWGYSPVSIIDTQGAIQNSDIPEYIQIAMKNSQIGRITFEELEKSNCAVSSGNLFLSKNLVQSGYKFDQTLKHIHDWFLVQRLFLKSEPIHLNATTYLYRMHGSNTFKSIPLMITLHEYEYVRKRIRSEIWLSCENERIFTLLQYKLLAGRFAGKFSTSKEFGPINLRGYQIVDLLIEQLRNRKYLYGGIKYVGKKLEKLMIRN